MQLQENGPLMGTEEGSAGDLFANLRVLEKKKKKKKEQLINSLLALPKQRDQYSSVVPPFFVKWYLAASSALGTGSSLISTSILGMDGLHRAGFLGLPLLSSINLHTKQLHR